MYILQLLNNPVEAILFLLAIIIAVSIHEFAHAKVATELGDPTAELAGRVTVNPKAHLDPMGSILFLLVGFGWGRPVPFDIFNLKNPLRDAAIISAAGPISNFIVVILGALIFRLLQFVELSGTTLIGLQFLAWVIRVNLTLGMFNLLPFAPLDGFKFVGGLLPKKNAIEWYGLERYGLLFLLFFIFPLIGNRSMLEIFVLPIINFLTKILLG